jgi:hypothetical protein
MDTKTKTEPRKRPAELGSSSTKKATVKRQHVEEKEDASSSDDSKYSGSGDSSLDSSSSEEDDSSVDSLSVVPTPGPNWPFCKTEYNTRREITEAMIKAAEAELERLYRIRAPKANAEAARRLKRDREDVLAVLEQIVQEFHAAAIKYCNHYWTFITSAEPVIVDKYMQGNVNSYVYRKLTAHNQCYNDCEVPVIKIKKPRQISGDKRPTLTHKSMKLTKLWLGSANRAENSSTRPYEDEAQKNYQAECTK